MSTTRVSLMLPADWVAAIHAQAVATETTDAEVMRRGILRELPRDVRKSLSTPRPRGRIPKDQR